MTQRKKIAVSIILFFIIFGSLLTIATFFDLQIDKLLAGKALPAGQYVSDNIFGATFEVVGPTGLNFMLAFAFHILFWYGVNSEKKILTYVLTSAMAILSVVDYYVLCSDTMGYIRSHIAFENGLAETEMGSYIKVVYLFFAIVATIAGLFVVKNFSRETICKLFRFAIAVILLTAIPTILINLVIKEPVGRIRYRAMNMNPDDPVYGFSAFARWYEVNGQWLDDATKEAVFGTTDALKSFPSGHTSAAGITYGLVMLIPALDIKNKKMKAFLWIFPILFTGTVALSRLVVGAHFMSDVLMGGTISFVTMIIVRELVVCRCSDVKILLGKNNKADEK